MAKRKPAPTTSIDDVLDEQNRENAQASESTPGPRQPALPGHEQVRNVELDRLCEEFGENRAIQARAAGVERELRRVAVEALHASKLSVYKFAGVEFALIPGDEKLRARLTGDDGAIQN